MCVSVYMHVSVCACIEEFFRVVSWVISVDSFSP